MSLWLVRPPLLSLHIRANRNSASVHMIRALAEETWEYIMTKSRDQDIFYFFSGLQSNPKTRHFLVEHFRKDYDKVCSVLTF